MSALQRFKISSRIGAAIIVTSIAAPPARADIITMADIARGIVMTQAQCAAIPQLGKLAALKGRGPGAMTGWRMLPAVPSGAYKRYDLFAGTLPAARTFVSSGTSGTAPSRVHYSPEGLALMDAALSLIHI